jgi:predicted phage tail protein
MNSFDPSPETNPAPKPSTTGMDQPAEAPARVGTIVWGLVVLALAVLITVSQMGIVVLNGTYVLIGLMIGAGAALVIGGVLSARKRDNRTTNGKS